MFEKSDSSLHGISGQKISTSIIKNTGSPVSEINGKFCVTLVSNWLLVVDLGDDCLK